MWVQDARTQDCVAYCSARTGTEYDGYVRERVALPGRDTTTVGDFPFVSFRAPNPWTILLTVNDGYYDFSDGTVGVRARRGSDEIGSMTHDMVHRTHLDICVHYYPTVFSAWWIDDWITKVYEPS